MFEQPSAGRVPEGRRSRERLRNFGQVLQQVFPFCRTTPGEVQNLPDPLQMFESGYLVVWILVNAHRQESKLRADGVQNDCWQTARVGEKVPSPAESAQLYGEPDLCKRLVNRLSRRIRGVRSGLYGKVERFPVVRE